MSGEEAVKTNTPPTPSILDGSGAGKTLTPTFEVVKTVDEQDVKKAVKKTKAKKKKTSAKKVQRKTKATKETGRKVAKKKVAKKVVKTARQLGAAKAAALRHADPKLRKAIMTKREQVKKTTKKLSEYEKQLKVLEAKL